MIEMFKRQKSEKPQKLVSGKKKLKKLGQSLVEYGLILALVSVVSIVVLNKMGLQIKNTVQMINSRLANANALSQAASGS